MYDLYKIFTQQGSCYHIYANIERMTLFKNKYRVESSRLPDWDYGQAGYYYVTICTKNREPFLGTIVQDDILLSPIGNIVAEEWLKTAVIRPNIELDAWIIMPNHVHLIVLIFFSNQV